MNFRGAVTVALLLVAWWFGSGCGGPGPEWDGVVEIDYARHHVESQVKRRINLASGGVAARKGLAADSVGRARMFL